MKYISYIFWLVMLTLGVTFASLNAHDVNVNYYVRESLVSLPLLLVFVLAIGVFLGWLVTVPILIKTKYENRRLKRRVKSLEHSPMEISDPMHAAYAAPQDIYGGLKQEEVR